MEYLIFTQLQSLITWLLDPGGGGLAALVVGVPLLLEKIPSWAAMPKTWKMIIPFTVVVAIALTAVALRDNPDLVISMQKWYEPIAAVAYLWVGTELFHKATKA
jgi:hypothetical protein